MLLFFAFSVTAILLSVLFAFEIKRTKSKVYDGAIMYFKEDDSDIKIAGKEPVKDENSEAESEASELKTQRENGNVSKANELGSALSDKFISADGVSAFGTDSEENSAVKTQRRLLLAFTAVNTIEKNIENSILRDIVIKSFYDSLKSVLPDFYDELNKSGSFSFYTLAVRRGGETEKFIGETFAMLCGKEKDKVYTEFGTALYLKFVDVILKAVKSYDFK